MNRFRSTWIAFAVGMAASAPALAADSPKRDEAFRDTEIRVIRAKYFQKSIKLEMAGYVNALMNKPFIYTMMGSGQLNLHVTEAFSLFGEGGAGYSWNKGDCSMLGEKFSIEPIVDDLKNWYGGGLSYTPVYGKYQMASGDVLYFDWYFFGAGGMASLAKRQGSCIPNSAENTVTQSTMQFSVGTGQRYFMTKSLALNWNLRYMQIKDPEMSSIMSDPIRNVLLSLGVSYYLSFSDSGSGR